MTAEASAGWSAARRSPYALAVAGEIVVAIALLAGAGILAESQATDHSRLHLGIALAVLLFAGTVLRARPKASIASRAPIIGLVLFAGVPTAPMLPAPRLAEAVGR